MTDKLFEPSFEEHRQAQLLRMMRETTAEQRLQLLEEMLKFLHAAGVDYLAAKHRLIGNDVWRTGKEF
ncbi:MAG: hypothetical protein M3R13_00115 [Armatimonadota bacterium]|nr:hypothetical protein [Armatimonadota bacterium]